MSSAPAQAVSIGLAVPGLGPELFDFLNPHDYIHPDLDRTAFAECWRHQFFGDAPLPHYVLVARDEGGRLIAHYGIMPMPYAVHGKPVRAGFICQLFVDPAYRQTSLFFKLERRILQEYGQFGFDFLYGLITIKPVLKAHLGLGFTRGPDFHTYAFPLLPGSALGAVRPRTPGLALKTFDLGGRCLARAVLLLRRPASGRIGLEEITDLSRVDSELLTRVQSSWPIHAERSGEAMRRRIANFGRKRYRVFAAIGCGRHAGYIVLRHTRVQHFNVMVIVDVIAPQEAGAVWNALIGHACRCGLETGCCSVVSLARRGTAVARRLESNLFFPTPSFFTLVYAVPDRLRNLIGWPGSDLWHLSWFDHDFI